MSTIVKQRISDNKQDIEKLKIMIDAKIDKRDMIINNITELEKDNNERVKVLKKDNQRLNADKESAYLDVKAADASIQQYNVQLVDEPKIHTKLQKMRSIKTKIETNKENFCDKHKFLDEHEDCPTCKQKIDEEFKIDEQCRIDLKIVELDKGIAEITTEIKTLEAEVTKFNDIRKVITELHKQSAVASNSIQQFKVAIDKNTKEIISLEKGAGMTAALKTDLAAVIKEIADLMDKHKEAVEQKTVLVTAADMLKDGGIKSRIVKQYIPIINQTVNKYLKQLNFLVKFELDETFNETIKSRYRDDFSYNNFSEGEKMRIDLSLMLTWRTIAKARNSSSTNLLILDEIFDRALDAGGIDDFIKIMQSLSADTNVVVLTPRPQDAMMDNFSRTFKAEKKKNYSVWTEI
jgi:hypothetical protein